MRRLGTTPPSKLPPPSLPEGISSVAGVLTDAPWFGIHTRITMRGSKDAAVAWGLYLAGLPFYFPQKIRRRVERDTGRKRKDLVSAFSGYLFAAGKLAFEWCWDNPELVECTLKEARAGTLAVDLRMVEVSIAEDPEMRSGEIDGPGILVRVISGPWEGKEGVVEKVTRSREGVTRVWFDIETLGRKVSLELPSWQLEKLG